MEVNATQVQHERLRRIGGKLEYRILRDQSLNASNKNVKGIVLQCQRRTRSGYQILGE
ncbi:MAG: hypothetical protein OXG88_00495 [Gammaproteobacteria bacterium]|nr:hypothetical protein [Gammaproteobacteria bacterium]